MEEIRTAYNIFVGKPKGIEPLGRPRCRWDYNIKTYFRELGGKVWTEYIWLRAWTQLRVVVNTVMNLQVPQSAGNLLNS
jgi:hypothetical protein